MIQMLHTAVSGIQLMIKSEQSEQKVSVNSQKLNLNRLENLSDKGIITAISKDTNTSDNESRENFTKLKEINFCLRQNLNSCLFMY